MKIGKIGQTDDQSTRKSLTFTGTRKGLFLALVLFTAWSSVAMAARGGRGGARRPANVGSIRHSNVHIQQQPRQLPAQGNQGQIQPPKAQPLPTPRPGEERQPVRAPGAPSARSAPSAPNAPSYSRYTGPAGRSAVQVKGPQGSQWISGPRGRPLYTTLPAGSRHVNVGRNRYWYHQGRYYQRVYYNGRYVYVVRRTPAGVTVARLPAGYRRYYWYGTPYYYYGGTYYVETQATNDSEATYVTTNPPVGAEIEELPEGCLTEVVGSTPYYLDDDTWYLPVAKDEKTVYRVVESPR